MINLVHRRQQPGQFNYKLVIGITQCAVDIEAYSLDAGSIDGHGVMNQQVG